MKFDKDNIKKIATTVVPIILYVAERIVSDRSQEKQLKKAVQEEVEAQLAEQE